MKKKENNENNKKIKKQLISTGVYIALAATVLAITSNSVSEILDGKSGYELPDTDITKNHITLPELDKSKNDTISLPPQADIDYPEKEDTVSLTPEGISAEITDAKENSDKNGNIDVSAEPEDGKIPEETPRISFDSREEPSVRVKPASGYISREYSANELLYTPTMNDFRTHDGVDITGDIGSPVVSFADGEISDIYDDPLMGTTVVIRHSGGLVSSYSNLSPDLPATTVVGNIVSVGDVIGGIGESAIIESAEVPHVHFEIYKDEMCCDPQDYIE